MKGFVYCWTDKLTNMLYVGSHKGCENDGYICSSEYMLPEYNKRLQDFSRQIIAQGKLKDMRSLEIAILISEDAANNTLYYNRSNGYPPVYSIKDKTIPTFPIPDVIPEYSNWNLQIELQRVIAAIRNNKKPGGVLISKIVVSADMAKQTNTNNPSIIAYLVAHNMISMPTCSMCPNFTSFNGCKRGFSLICNECNKLRLSSYNSISNKTKNIKRGNRISQLLEMEFNLVKDKILQEYINNVITIKELTDKYHVCYNLTRKYLHELKLTRNRPRKKLVS